MGGVGRHDQRSAKPDWSDRAAAMFATAAL